MVLSGNCQLIYHIFDPLHFPFHPPLAEQQKNKKDLHPRTTLPHPKTKVPPQLGKNQHYRLYHPRSPLRQILDPPI
jgi:hypothetical protein